MTSVISRAPKLAFVQGHQWGGYLSPSCSAVAESLAQMGYDVETFLGNKLPPKHKVTPKTPVKGGTMEVKCLYERLFPGVTYPNIDVPKELAKYGRREIITATLGEVRAMATHTHSFTKFIKPLNQAKLFPGRELQYATTSLKHLPDHTPVAIHDYRRFQDEVRLFVTHKGEITTASGWFGTSRELAKLQKFAAKLHKTWKHVAPKCYVMDVAMSAKQGTPNYRPTLVEINSVLTAGNLNNIPNPLPGKVVAAGWKSYARYGETGNF